MNKPYCRLANAIIIQAAIDYRSYPQEREILAKRLDRAEKRLASALLSNDNKRISRASRCKATTESKLSALEEDYRLIEPFFNSEWFKTLSSANGQMIFQRLQTEGQKMKVNI